MMSATIAKFENCSSCTLIRSLLICLAAVIHDILLPLFSDSSLIRFWPRLGPARLYPQPVLPSCFRKYRTGLNHSAGIIAPKTTASSRSDSKLVSRVHLKSLTRPHRPMCIVSEKVCRRRAPATTLCRVKILCAHRFPRQAPTLLCSSVRVPRRTDGDPLKFSAASRLSSGPNRLGFSCAHRFRSDPNSPANARPGRIAFEKLPSLTKTVHLTSSSVVHCFGVHSLLLLAIFF